MKTILAAVMGVVAMTTTMATGPRFSDRDPVMRAAEELNASAVRPSVINAADGWNALRGAGDRTLRRALNINSIGEVPDSSWFTNRIGQRPMSIDEIVTGPDSLPAPPRGPWTIIGGKTDGITPGLRLADAEGRRFFVKFDPPGNPEMASGAEVVATKLLFALGYNVPENYIAALRREDLSIASGATFKGPDGQARHITASDIDRLLRRVARNADGSYRILASRQLEGTPVGPFRYAGTRADDPNDTVPHEHRRELRALRVFAAWLNHVDTKSQNSLDTIVHEGSRTVIRHHLIDFGSALGSAGIGPKDRREGYEYLLEARRALLSLLTFGVYAPSWTRIRYPSLPAIGRIEGAHFRVDRWKPTFPNAAFDNARGDDLFWAAERVMAFSDDAIREVVATARFSDPAAAAYLADTLIARRDRIGASLLTAANPIAQPVVADGRLTFHNAATEAGIADEPLFYHVRWYVFDNDTGTTSAVTPWTSIDGMQAVVPPVPPATSFLAVDIAAAHPRFPSWATPARAYFRRERGDTWALVGFERLPSQS
jgi:hypothetical protein